MTSVTIRYRLNCRLPDAEKKYRDEQTMECEVSLEDPSADIDTLTKAVEVKAKSLRAGFYQEAKRLGGADYIEVAG